MPPSPALSVVVPTHDSRELTLDCVGSLPGGSGMQVVVVDDASEDGTDEALASRFPEVEVVRSVERLGFGRAANLGLGRAAGEVLLLLNSDARPDPGSLDALLAAFAARLRLGIGGGELRFPDGRPQWSGGAAPGLAWFFGLGSGLPALLGRSSAYRRLRPVSGRPGPVDWVTGAALALRRRVWLDCGPFDERFRFYAQDLDLCQRARRAGWEVAVVPGFSVVHHQGATIGRSAESARAGAGAGRQHPELLWADLLCWAEKERGPKWARRATLALAAGARLRLAARCVGLVALPRSARDPWRADTRAFQQALTALRRA